MRRHIRRRKALQLHRARSWPREFVRVSDYVAVARGQRRWMALVHASNLNLGADAEPYLGPVFPMEIGRIDSFRFITSPVPVDG